MRNLLTKREAAKRVGYHPEHIMRLSRDGRFPKPIRLGPTDKCAVRWIEEEIENWIVERMAERLSSE